MQTAIGATGAEWLPCPEYRLDAEENTRILNGHAIRNLSLDPACLVGSRLFGGEFPVVVGGDWTILLGRLAGASASGRVGLLHIDGHSDFFHSGDYDAGSPR
ncbi:arginase family protein [Xanthobacter sp. AM11]|uniref:arginase family protein n=1 Tax=Xanthobacter sp. AM11 TaxID=3380643 RepID=UPI0039BF3794